MANGRCGNCGKVLTPANIHLGMMGLEICKSCAKENTGYSAFFMANRIREERDREQSQNRINSFQADLNKRDQDKLEMKHARERREERELQDKHQQRERSERQSFEDSITHDIKKQSNRIERLNNEVDYNDKEYVQQLNLKFIKFGDYVSGLDMLKLLETSKNQGKFDDAIKPFVAKLNELNKEKATKDAKLKKQANWEKIKQDVIAARSAAPREVVVEEIEQEQIVVISAAIEEEYIPVQHAPTSFGTWYWIGCAAFMGFLWYRCWF